MLACKACICSIYGYSLRGIYPLYSLQGILRKQLRQAFFTVDIVSLSLRLSLSLLLPLLLLTSLSLLLFSVGLPVSAVHSLCLSMAVVRRAALRHALSVSVGVRLPTGNRNARAASVASVFVAQLHELYVFSGP